MLWFAWKYLPLWYQQQLVLIWVLRTLVVICLKISTFVVSTTTKRGKPLTDMSLWFAWKYLPLWYQQQLKTIPEAAFMCCDLLENIYLCGINNNSVKNNAKRLSVVICLKISTFVVSTTTVLFFSSLPTWLWFAWKYLPLWYQQQPARLGITIHSSCDLLENIYLCGINNN